MAKQQRQGVASRGVWYKETVYGEDTGITDGFVVPLSDTTGFEITRGQQAVNVFTGRRRWPGVVSANTTAEGDIVPQMDFSFLGHALQAFVGPDGTSNLLGQHTFIMPDVDGAIPQSIQFEHASLESTAQYLRARGLYVNSLRFQGAQSGGANYSIGLIGNGDKVVGTTPLDASPTVYPFKAVDYFNGFIKLNGKTVVGAMSFNVTFNNNFTRTDAFFNNGIASSLSAGIPSATGTLGLVFGVASGTDPEDTINFYNMAINQQDIPVECLWANAPLTANPSEWFNLKLMVRFGEKSWKVAGATGLTIEQNFDILQSTSADWGAENIGTIAGPYNTTTNNKLAIKVDGAAKQVVTLDSGAAITAAAIVDDINTGTTGCVADVFNGRVRITSDTKGSAGSIQIDTAETNSAHAELGFGNTVVAGIDDSPFVGQLFNGITTAY